jgi:hypothetical protein
MYDDVKASHMPEIEAFLAKTSPHLALSLDSFSNGHQFLQAIHWNAGFKKCRHGGFRAYRFVCCLLCFYVRVRCFILGFDDFSSGVLGEDLVLN